MKREQWQTDAQNTRRVADNIVAALRGQDEGAQIEWQLWPACNSAGISREVFDRAIFVLLTSKRVEQSYDRIYVFG